MKRIAYSVLLAASLILSACSSPNSNSTQQQQTTVETVETVDLKIGYSRLRISLPVFAAQEEGIFEKNGINADLVMYETAQPLMGALIEDKVQVAGFTALPITYNGMIRNNKDLLFVSLMMEDESHRISYLLKKKGDSEINSIADLKGKTIGILPTIAYQAWIGEILRQNGLDPENDVVIQQVAPTQQGITLKSGGVDVLFTNDPAATSAMEAGVAELLSEQVDCPAYLGSPFPFGSFNVSKEWADKNPELFQKVVKSLDEAIAFVNDNQEAAKLHMKKYLPEQFQGHVLKYPDALYWTSDQVNDQQLNEISKKYFELGIIPEELDLTGLIAH